MISGVKSIWRSVTSGVPQWAVLDSVLFNSFINVLNYNALAEPAFSELADDTKVEGVTNKPEG